jgi:DNA primase
MAAPDSVPLWRAYRPLSEGSIAAWQLGIGVLPASKCAHRRLVVPIRREGRVVALAGRALTCDCPKWTLAGGSEFALFNADFISEGSTVVVVENRADAVLCCQTWPSFVTVAKGSANVWRPEWTARMLAARPSLVRFWPDHDPAGMAGAVRGANELLAAGLRADVVRWHPTYPPKYDLGSFLGDLMAEAEVA